MKAGLMTKCLQASARSRQAYHAQPFVFGQPELKYNYGNMAEVKKKESGSQRLGVWRLFQRALDQVR
jgi:hypothetical protein